ncbi:MAG: peptidoglycan-binding domain-containing protein [Actinomycetota bacterium]
MRAIPALAVAAVLAAAPALAEYTTVLPLGGSSALRVGPKQAWRPTDARTIADAQRELKALGYYPGEINGLYDNNTQQAVLDFQANNAVAPSGQLDVATLTAMGWPTAPQQAQAAIPGTEEPSQQLGSIEHLRSEHQSAPATVGQPNPPESQGGVPSPFERGTRTTPQE